jgi:TonB family protein
VSGRSYFLDDTGGWAQDMLLGLSRAMTGLELIEGDRQADQLIAEMDQAVDEGIKGALRTFYTPEIPVRLRPAIVFARDLTVSVPATPSDSPIFRPGCALEHGKGCPPARDIGPGSHCTGELPRLDAEIVSPIAYDVHISQPTYPTAARRWGLEGRVIVLAHVDRSGWICGATLALSSGAPLLDAAAVDDVARWKLRPGTHDAEPVESLWVGSIKFRIEGGQLKK